MQIKSFSGCSYIDAMPGKFVALRVNQYLETHLGNIVFPPGESFGLMFIRCSWTVADGFKFAGLSHDLGQIWEWTEARGWSHIDKPFAGNNPIIYDLAGNLRTDIALAPNGSVSSQGWRFVAADGTLVTGQDTYGPEHGLSQWTQVGSLRIGQGHDFGGILVWDGLKLRQLWSNERADFIIPRQFGTQVLIPFWGGDQAYIIDTTEEDLKLLPEVQLNPAPPAPTPPVQVPPLVVPPTKESPSVSIQNQLATVEQIRAKYPTPLGPRHPDFLVEVALATGGKLLRKDSGTHVTLASGDNVSQDIVVYGSTGVDILSDGEGLATAVWQVKEGETFDASRLVSVAVVGDTHPAPIPGLPGPEVDMTKVSQAISEALAPLDERLNVIGLKVSEVAAQLEALLKAPAKAPKTIKVQSSRAFGHSHSVEFVV